MLGSSTEYALHCLVWLVQPREQPVSSRDLAELQGISPSLVAKTFPKLQKAGIVRSMEGVAGGYRLARTPGEISVLNVADAVEGRKSVFDCKEVRRNCVLFEGEPPAWSAHGVCGIHAVMLRAEKAMRTELARTSLLDLARGVKFPPDFGDQVGEWFAGRLEGREQARMTAVKDRTRRPVPLG